MTWPVVTLILGLVLLFLLGLGGFFDLINWRRRR